MNISEQTRPFTSKEEQEILCRYAKGGTVLEIGSYDGASAMAMAKVAERVYCLDPFLEDPAVNQNIYPSIAKFLINTIPYGNINLFFGTNREILPLLRPNAFTFVFVDGSHTYENALFDIYYAKILAREYLAIHDCNWPGVKRAIETTLPDGRSRFLVENYQNVLKVWRNNGAHFTTERI